MDVAKRLVTEIFVCSHCLAWIVQVTPCNSHDG
jgi:hypothetical protein